ncbi:MHS family shikimate/dehydroshikimate transporter-like MFS transporter [Mycobacterium frederiksbergense]|uniref:MHS family shikimate/dehydroshikimate transporter-like MFS transporter n=1 Tax=Mycolicibacterium frederiksbergense TaxID=117567 RepID=A0ABT6L4G9_9MYCO|nr:MFS transporter [Mycolicibacterium frederiksbergense]MDH6197824.1 MHS family shikimate/dehydroshikimate transporter-like MFS transporter [Mycolicibacterium frederiksbergense]
MATETNAVDRRRTAAAALVGTAVEYYDFALYGAAAAVVFGTVFFPNTSPATGMLASFATYAVGFAARPLGGFIFGTVGDRSGRKPALIVTLLLMGVATVGIGLIPSYASIGIWAPILLIGLRLVQGLGAGAEYAGAVALSTESAGQARGGLFGALPGTGSYIGSLVALLTFQLVARLDDDALYSWGWRIPFLLALPLLAVSLWIRARVDESPEYVALRENAVAERREHPFRLLFSKHRTRAVIGLGLNFTLTGYSYVLQVFSVSYLINELNMDRSLSLIIGASAYGCGVLTLPLFGILGDRIGPSRLFIAANIGSILFVIPFWLLLDTRDPLIAAGAVIFGLPVLIGAQFSTQPVLYKRLFPTEVRYSGIAFSREVTGAALGGTAPLIAAALVGSDGNWHALALFMIVVSSIALVSAIVAARMGTVSSPTTSVAQFNSCP